MIAAQVIWLVVFGFVFLVVFNFLPAVVAYVDGHPDRHLLAALTVLSLFSFALWIGLMTWAVRGTSDHPLVQRFLGSPDRRRLFVALVAAVIVGGLTSTLTALQFA